MMEKFISYEDLTDLELDERLQDLGRKVAAIMVFQPWKNGSSPNKGEREFSDSLMDELEAVKSEIESRKN